MTHRVLRVFCIGAILALGLHLLTTNAHAASAPNHGGTGIVMAAPAPMLAQNALWEQYEYAVEQFEKGGNTMYFLAALSIAGLAFILERLFRLRRGRIVPRGLAAQADDLWKQRRFEEIQMLCANSNSSLARIINFIVRHRLSDPPAVTAAVTDMGARELRPHFRRTYPLAVVATLSPLLGLFGTVIGMIAAFQKFRQLGEEGDPAVFADAISLALITTATGLAIAVPTLGFYHYFRSLVNKYGDMLEAEVSELVNEWLILREDEEESHAA